ncbi:MAG: acetate kinase [Acidobacteriia bacterium]|nr:acetate kinase [Terriglobia bacterium]
MKILALNGGSSSFKASLFELAGSPPAAAPPPLWDARVDFKHHEGSAEIRIAAADGAPLHQTIAVASPLAALEPLLAMLWSGAARAVADRAEIAAIGHRIVHGGKAFRQSTRISPDVMAAIARLASFAPEHNRLEVEAIEEAERIFGPATPQVAVFDTAFHATLPPAAYVYPGPYDWLAEGTRRYGFHGISHQYVSRRAAEILGRDLHSLRMIACHLGSGCSLAAISGGESVDTTMGFTPLEGLMMGTRSGSIDPGILIHLVRHCGYRAEDLDRVLNQESGLKGLSGISGDMRDILSAMAAGHERARLAFDVYVHRLCASIGAMTASLRGLDALVFTAGVGENCAPLRAAACETLAFLGMKIDPVKNDHAAEGDADIAAADSAIRIVVVRTQEEWEIAKECARVLTGG